MGRIWVRELTGGLDVRRMSATTAGGVLIKGEDGHINSGGEFEKRPAFVSSFTLPAGTVGLARNTTGLVVFGHTAAPVGVPAGVSYQRLQHPTSSGLALDRVLSFDLYGSKVYAVGQFADGSIHHYYDGVNVTDWFDGRARASFDVTAGAVTAATSATGSFEVIGGGIDPAVAAVGSFLITGGTLGGGNEITSVEVDGVAILTGPVNHTGNNSTTATAVAAAINLLASSPNYSASAVGAKVTITASTTGVAANGRAVVVTVGGDATFGSVEDMAGGAAATPGQVTSVEIDGVAILTGPIAHTGNNSTTASAIAAAINSLSSSPDYTASANGQTVSITTAVAGTAANGKAIVVAVSGAMTVGNVVNMAGGAASITSRVTKITVNGVAIINAPVSWTTSNEATATAIASAINSFTSTPDYEATAVGDQVNIIAEDAGTTPNGYSVVVTVANGLTVSPPSGVTMADGATSAAFVPGGFVRTIGSKVYSVSDGVLHFSGIRRPTKWTTDATGAGFIDMSQETSDAEDLTAVANYQGFVAVFAPRVVLVWYVDPDPDLNSKRQILKNTGTRYPKSVTEFGDSDLFYLSDSGQRSLKARDSSNAAATTDIGSPIDALVRAKLRTMTDEQRENIVGLINPDDGRFWLCMADTVYVFSFYPQPQVSAWTTYKVGTTTGTTFTGFDIEDAVVQGDKVYVRSGNTIYSFGGLEDEPTYDATVAKAHLPFLSAEKPTEFKGWNGFDCAVEGTWSVYVAQVVKDSSVRELAAVATGVTFDEHTYSLTGMSTHVSLQFESQGTGAAVLSSALLHYVGGEDK